MKHVVILRGPNTHDGAFGKLQVQESNYSCATLEKRDLNNQPDISSIPKGVYNANKRRSEKHNCDLFHIDGVNNRSNIEIHAANWEDQLLGCVAVGKEIKPILRPDGISFKMGVSDSRLTLAAFMSEMGDADFELRIL